MTSNFQLHQTYYYVTKRTRSGRTSAKLTYPTSHRTNLTSPQFHITHPSFINIASLIKSNMWYHSFATSLISWTPRLALYTFISSEAAVSLNITMTYYYLYIERDSRAKDYRNSY